ncbi:MAG: WbqC family protein [Blastocatellia bacterium]|nr:WbqC family protein [Blastocatellia bacterium]
MRIVILQPGYIPWLGFFDQLHRADIFVVYDDVQYTRRDWRSRNRIKAHSGEHWLSVPVKNHGKFDQLIKDAEIDYSQKWTRKHLGAISTYYKQAPFFEEYFPQLESLLNSSPKLLLELDLQLIKECAQWLGITTPLVLASTLNAEGRSSERLISICKKLAATDYLTGKAAQSYLDEKLFSEAGITVEYHEYAHPRYRQLHGEFIPYMSVIDLLFNHGLESLPILTGRVKIDEV